MADGLPLRLPKERDHSDGDICEHEQGKCKEVEHLLVGLCANGVPFDKGGYRAKRKHDQSVVRKTRYRNDE